MDISRAYELGEVLGALSFFWGRRVRGGGEAEVEGGELRNGVGVVRCRGARAGRRGE